MIPNLEQHFRTQKLKIVNIKVSPFCNIHLILKYCVGLKYIRAVSSKVLQKMNLDRLVFSRGSGKGGAG